MVTTHSLQPHNSFASVAGKVNDRPTWMVATIEAPAANFSFFIRRRGRKKRIAMYVGRALRAALVG
jgi:hypothetical protein